MGLRADLIQYGLSGPGPCSRSFPTETYPLSDFSGVMNFNSDIPQQWAAASQPRYMLLVPEQSTFTNQAIRIRKRDVARYFDSGVQISIAANPSQPRPAPILAAAISREHLYSIDSLETVLSNGAPTSELVHASATLVPAQVERCIQISEEIIVKNGQTKELAQAIPCDSVIARKKRTP